MRATLFIPFALLLAGCSSSPAIVTPATAEQKKQLWEPLTTLAGEWTTKDEQGKTVPALVIEVSANGSILHESMFPGSPYAMTNVYHLDGPSVVMTHYCAAGNQPRLRLTEASGGKFEFKSDSVTNLRSAEEPYMGAMTLTIKDADHFETEWITYAKGKEEPHAIFKYERKK